MTASAIPGLVIAVSVDGKTKDVWVILLSVVSANCCL